MMRLYGEGLPCAVIAELSNNANGKYENAVRLLDAAKAAGATAAKVQCYTAAELLALRGDGPAPAQWGEQGMSMADLYSKAMTPREWFKPLYDYAASIGLPIFASVFGLESLALLESIGNPIYKIAALDYSNTNRKLIAACHATEQQVLISSNSPTPVIYVGGTAEYLYAPAGYPTKAGDVHLPFKFVSTLWANRGDKLTWCAGLSSHCLDPDLPIAAVARGARIIEMHLMLRDEPSELEANVSLDQYQFADMVARVRKVEGMLG
jgi:sialic acid synthase SpsE